MKMYYTSESRESTALYLFTCEHVTAIQISGKRRDDDARTQGEARQSGNEVTCLTKEEKINNSLISDGKTKVNTCGGRLPGFLDHIAHCESETEAGRR